MIEPGAPPPPETDDWIQRLHWAVRAAGTDDRDLSFLASLLHHAIDRPGLTERQAKYAGRILDRLEFEWRSRPIPAVTSEIDADNLAGMAPAGRA